MQVQTENTAYDAALQQMAVLRDMPIFYSGLVVENTTRCNAKCAMCYQAAGPKGSDTWGRQVMAKEEIMTFVRDAIGIETLYPRFHLSGGEAFIDIDSCLEIFQVAQDVGFLDITTTTNAYWARRRPRAESVCRRLRKVGLSSMEISWDYWHSPYIDAEAVSNCLEVCAEYDIEANLRILCTKSHPYSEALDMLRPEAVEAAARISGGPVFATGRAAKEIPADDFHRQNSIGGNCHSVLNLTVNAKGNVYPCCAGLDQTNYVFGNVRDTPIQQIAKNLNQSPLVRTIVFSGISALIPMIERAGVPVGKDYNGICHLCWSIFSDPIRVAALEDEMAKASQRALRIVLEQLEAGEQELELT